MQIYLQRHDRQLGPFTEAEIRTKLASGEISLEDPVWWEGEHEWIPLGQSSLQLTLPLRVPGTMPELPDSSHWQSEEIAPTGPATSNLAIGSLTCGCLALLLWFLTSIPAIILGHLALREIKQTPDLKGRGLALGGLIIGYLMTVLTVAFAAVHLHLMPFHLKSAAKAPSTPQASVDFSQPLPPQPPPTTARQSPVPNDILFQPPPVDYSSAINHASSKSGGDSTEGTTNAPDTGTPAAPAPNR
jgi:hypothetical protein